MPYATVPLLSSAPGTAFVVDSNIFENNCFPVETALFLDGFEPNPAIGMPTVNTLVQMTPAGSALFRGPLDRADGRVLAFTMQETVFSALDIVTGEGKQALPSRLVDSGWTLSRYWGSRVDPRYGEATVVNPRQGKEIRFNFMRPDLGPQLKIAYSGPRGFLMQSTKLEAPNWEVKSDGYFLSMHGFEYVAKEILGLEKISLYEMAIALATLIYTSGQYSPEMLGGLKLKVADKIFDFDPASGSFNVSEDVRESIDSGKNPVLISSGAKVIPVSPEDPAYRFAEPVVKLQLSVNSHMNNLEEVNLWLNRSLLQYEAAIPLAQPLRERLWDTIQRGIQTALRD